MGLSGLVFEMEDASAKADKHQKSEAIRESRMEITVSLGVCMQRRF